MPGKPGVEADDVRPLVRGALGCQCPESVFDDVEIRDAEGDQPWRQSLRIGGRLLVVWSPAESGPALEGQIAALLREARGLRDRLGFQRLRVVLISDAADSLRPRAEALFNARPEADERSHIHCLERLDTVPGNG